MNTKHVGKKKKLSEDVITDDEGEGDNPRELVPSSDVGGSGLPSEGQANADGETFFELSKLRRVTLRKWRGKALVDIREFWEESGTLKPGKKGISLTPEQWTQLLNIAPSVSKCLDNMHSSS